MASLCSALYRLKINIQSLPQIPSNLNKVAVDQHNSHESPVGVQSVPHVLSLPQLLQLLIGSQVQLGRCCVSWVGTGNDDDYMVFGSCLGPLLLISRHFVVQVFF